MQQTPSSFLLVRRVLFPFSGENTLSLKQSLRIIIVWALFFTAPMLLCTLSLTIYTATPLYKTSLFLLVVFLAGVIIFGTSAWLVVNTINRSARLRLQSRDTRTSSTSGGSYGS
jgi:hypothetical protein